MAKIIFEHGEPVLRIDWYVEDVLAQAEEAGVELTEDDAATILAWLAHAHDAMIGINWDVIDTAIDMFDQDRQVMEAVKIAAANRERTPPASNALVLRNEYGEDALFKAAHEMKAKGGGFASRIAESYFYADIANRTRILNAFGDLFEDFVMAT